MFLAQGQRGTDAFLEKGLVDFDAVRVDQTHVDLRFGIVKADPEEALAMIFDLDDIAVSRRLGETLDVAVINPGMSGEDAVGFTRAKQYSRQSLHRFVNRDGSLDARGRISKGQSCDTVVESRACLETSPVGRPGLQGGVN